MSPSLYPIVFYCTLETLEKPAWIILLADQNRSILNGAFGKGLACH